MPVPRDVKLWLGFNIIFFSSVIIFLLKEIYCLVFHGYVIGNHLHKVPVGSVSGILYGCFYAFGVVVFAFMLDSIVDSFSGNTSHSFHEKKLKEMGVFGKGVGLRIMVSAGSAFFGIGVIIFLLLVPK